jgi:hypothetical protein
MGSVELHLFTNSTLNSPSTKIIEETYKSFTDIFNINIPTKVWCDINPNTEKAKEYIENLKKIFPDVIETNSLADGYVKSLTVSRADYMFMLEHDWKFLPSITNTLDEIIFDMNDQKLWYLLFNKFHNFDASHHSPIGDFKKGNYICYYLINRISNNPHIINRKLYIEMANEYIKFGRGGALGIEQELTASPLIGAVYGSKSTRATIYHIDGRKQI